MLNVRHIMQGWYRTIFKDPKSTPMMKERGKVCLGCEHAKVMPIGRWFKGEYEELREMSCTQCGCPLEPKLRVEEESCPLNKW